MKIAVKQAIYKGIKAKETYSSLSNLLDANTIKEVPKNILKIIFEQVNNFELGKYIAKIDIDNLKNTAYEQLKYLNQL